MRRSERQARKRWLRHLRNLGHVEGYQDKCKLAVGFGVAALLIVLVGVIARQSLAANGEYISELGKR